MISIAGLDKAELLIALYTPARALGLGELHYTDAPLTREEAQKALDNGRGYIDYLRGRPLKVDLSGDEMSTGLYDRDQGAGACERIVNSLRARAAE